MRPIAARAMVVVERTRVSQVTPESPGIPRAMTPKQTLNLASVLNRQMPFVPRSTFEVAVVWTMRRTPSQAGQMRRRDFITALGTAATWPLAVRAQQPTKMKRIALVSSAGKVSAISVSGSPNYRVFFEELSRLGYVEGQN